LLEESSQTLNQIDSTSRIGLKRFILKKRNGGSGFLTWKLCELVFGNFTLAKELWNMKDFPGTRSENCWEDVLIGVATMVLAQSTPE